MIHPAFRATSAPKRPQSSVTGFRRAWPFLIRPRPEVVGSARPCHFERTPRLDLAVTNSALERMLVRLQHLSAIDSDSREERVRRATVVLLSLITCVAGVLWEAGDRPRHRGCRAGELVGGAPRGPA
jgi:hypothetical protein